MRQASWIAFLLLSIGLISYEASLDQQEATVNDGSTELAAADGGWENPPPPKP